MPTDYHPTRPTTKQTAPRNQGRCKRKTQAKPNTDSSRRTRLRERLRRRQRTAKEWWDLDARAALEAGGFNRRSFKYGYCVCRDGLFRCNQHLLCDRCRFARAAKQAKDYAARIVLAREANPKLTLLACVFSVGERDSYADQAEELLKVLGRVGRKKVGAWSKVRGVIWHIEPALSPSGRWFAHLHCILAIDTDDQPRHQLQLKCAFATTARRVCYPGEPFVRTSPDPRLDALHRLQHVQPVWAFPGNRFASRLSADASIEEIAHHSARLIMYARKSGGLQERGDLRDLRPVHLVEVVQHKGHMAGTKGVFRALPEEDLLAMRLRLFPDNRITTRLRVGTVASTNAPKVTSPPSPGHRRRRRAKAQQGIGSALDEAPGSSGRGVVPKGQRRSKREASPQSADLVSKRSP